MMMMLICTKQHLSNICGSIHEKVSNSAAELKKGVAYNKKRVTHFLRKEHFQFFAHFLRHRKIEQPWIRMIVFPHGMIALA